MCRYTTAGAGGVGIDATLGQCGCHASRAHGIGAREKYMATLRASSTTLTTFGLKISAGSVIGCAAVAIAQPLFAARCDATPHTSAGSISGSSPCTFTTIVSSLQPNC